MKRYYYSEPGQPIEGPVTMPDLERLAEAGKISATVRVKPMGGTAWESLAEVRKERAPSDSLGELGGAVLSEAGRLRRTKFNRLATIVLVAGMGLAALLYRSPARVEANDDGSEAPLALENSRKGARQLEMVDGAAGLLGYRLSRWAGEESAALAAAGSTAAISAVLFFLGTRESGEAS